MEEGPEILASGVTHGQVSSTAGPRTAAGASPESIAAKDDPDRTHRRAASTYISLVVLIYCIDWGKVSPATAFSSRFKLMIKGNGNSQQLG